MDVILATHISQETIFVLPVIEEVGCIIFFVLVTTINTLDILVV